MHPLSTLPSAGYQGFKADMNWPQTPGTPGPHPPLDGVPDVPQISEDDSIADIVERLYIYFVETIDLPYTLEQLRTTHIGHRLGPLSEYLVETVQHRGIVSALLMLRYHFNDDGDDRRGVNVARSNACEMVAWRFVSCLTEHEALDFLLLDLPKEGQGVQGAGDVESGQDQGTRVSSKGDLSPGEDSPLLARSQRRAHERSSEPSSSMDARTHLQHPHHQQPYGDCATDTFSGMNALEIAVIVGAKKFISQPSVQRIIDGIWKGNIVFWDSLSVDSKKKPRFFNARTADPYCRLRVPRYQTAFEVLFMASFLALYYVVMLQREPWRVTTGEVLLDIWIAAFAYDELVDFTDAGLLLYATDFWTPWDLGIICVGATYMVTRLIGLIKADDKIVGASFDILSLEALFLVPRIFSVLSLYPYFGTLIPCLKEMTKDFFKFLSIVAILYIGFLTTFTLLGRDHFTLSQMSWMLIQVFFGSSYIGFDAMQEISPILGPPLMLIFVCLTNILLITSLISLLSNSLSQVMMRAREEYLFGISVFVLEISSSKRLTQFYPPLNLLPLMPLRPLRLVLSADTLRRARIVLLKLTHVSLVVVIWAFERGSGRLRRRTASLAALARSRTPPSAVRHRLAPPQWPALRDEMANHRRPRPRSRAFAEIAAATAATAAAAKGTSAGPTMEDPFHVDKLGEIVQQLSIEVERLAKRKAEHEQEHEQEQEQEQQQQQQR